MSDPLHLDSSIHLKYSNFVCKVPVEKRPRQPSIMEEETKQNPKIKKEKEKKKNDSEFEFCKVCKLNHDQGRRHNYFPNHTKSLSSFLSRFLKRLTDVRFFLKNPTVLRPEHASNNRLWCVFCDCDIEELESVFTCTNAINHLASSEHLKNLKNFLWKYGGGMNRVDSFRISEADLSKWEKRCRALNTSGPLSSEGTNGTFLLPSKDIHNVLTSDNIDSLGKNVTCSFSSSLSNGFVPLQRFTNEKHQELHTEVTGVANVGALIFGATSLEECRDNQQIITVNSGGSLVGSSSNNKGVYQVGGLNNGGSSKKEPKENVHSGAPPPWLKSEENQLNVHSSAGLQVNGLVSSLHKSGASQKLNPKRVGAAWAEKRKIELEMEKRGEVVQKDCDADWLPNFGRVWQSGSRRESRKQFELEKEKLLNVDNLSEAPIKIQPYISKRMRKTNGESEGVVDNHSSEL